MKNKKKRKNSLRGIVITLVVVALAGAGYWYYVSHPRPKDVSKAPSIGQQTKGEQGQDSTPNKDNNSDGENPETPQVLLEPIGNFVSSHEVEMNSLIASSCTTTSGADCVITFTKDGVTKSLAKQATDSEGSTFWEWTPKQIGLSPGDWTIEARATLHADSKSSKDASALTVK